MTVITRMVLKFYRVLLRCYPSDFQVEFGDEMENVFRMLVISAAQNSWRTLIRCCLHELIDCPRSVFREHLQSRRTKMTEPSEPFPIKRNELWAGLSIFLIPALAAFLVEIIGEPRIPVWIGRLMVVGFLGCVIVPFIWAVIRGLPRWSTPYLGVLLVGFVFFVPFWPLIELIYPAFTRWIGPMYSWSLPVRIFYQGAQAAVLWLTVLLAAFVLVSLLRLWKHTRPLWQQVQQDRTLLSFILYGGLVLNIIIIFDEYQGNGPWMAAAWLSLGIGGWFYLRARDQKQRLIILLCGATLAMWIVAVGKWMLVPSQNWHPWLEQHPADTERWFESLRTLADWLCLSVALLIPSLLNLFPQKHKVMAEEGSSLASGT